MSATIVNDPLLRQRAAAEIPLHEKMDREHADRLYAIPWIAEDRVLETLLREAKPQEGKTG
ncbi:MAG: hypothetical protein ACNA8K_04615 [Cyclonatronaceae bacterium]